MLAESRRDVRYQSSQKAVLHAEGGTGSLCVITDFSSGGLCLAVVGAPGPWKRERIDVEVNHRTLPCTIVDGGQTKLHCQFEHPLDESDLLVILPPDRDVVENEMTALEAPSETLALSYGQAEDNEAESSDADKSSLRGAGRFDLSVVYIEGSLAGREQIDPAIDAIDATVDALNPYQSPEEREHWKQGFQDAVRLVAKHLAR